MTIASFYPESRALRTKALLLAHRFLGLGDRDPSRSTYGCFDRHYWCYKLHDLANARCQEAALFLALAAPLASADTSRSLFAMSRAAMRFWSATRHRDGSVDEVYPFERSFCATSMSAQAVAGAWLLVPDPPALDFTPTADWLARNNNPEVANQMAGACLALARISHITGRNEYLRAAREKFAVIADRQLSCGSYAEYSGADAGYATITLALLAGYHDLCEDPTVLVSMRACATWLEGLVDENGLYDWRSMSRRTQFLYPSGLAALESPILKRMGHGLARDVMINPLWMDDRYSLPLAIDYLLAATRLDGRAGTP